MSAALTKGFHPPHVNNDFVICQICGAQGLDLRKHVRRRHRQSEEEYLFRYPGHGLIAETLRELLDRWRRSYARRIAGLKQIGEILPDVVAGFIAERERKE